MRPTFMIAARTRREYDSLNVGGDPLPPHRQEVVGSAVGFERSLLPPHRRMSRANVSAGGADGARAKPALLNAAPQAVPRGPVVRRRSLQLALAELPLPCPRAGAPREALECIPGMGSPPATRGRTA
jgi:hypothetical protein